jgi:hypothetical protein
MKKSLFERDIEFLQYNSIEKIDSIEEILYTDNTRYTISTYIDIASDKKILLKNFLNNFHLTNKNGIWLNTKTITSNFINNSIIDNHLGINSITSIPKGFLLNSTIGSLGLDRVTKIPKDFLKSVTIRGHLYLSSLKVIPKDFLKGVTIGGNLYLGSIGSLPKDFKPDVKGRIFLTNLNSKILKNLMEYPGPKRQLAFNLLKTL